MEEAIVGDFALESQLVHFWDFAEVAEPGVVMDDALKSKVFGQHWLRGVCAFFLRFLPVLLFFGL